MEEESGNKIAVSKAEYQRLLDLRKFVSSMNAAYFTMEIETFELTWIADSSLVQRVLGISAAQTIQFGKIIAQQVREGADFDESITEQQEYFKNTPNGKWSGVFRITGFQGQSTWLLYSSTPLEWNENGSVKQIAVVAIAVNDIFNTPLTLHSFRDHLIKEVAKKDVDSLSPKQREVLKLIAQHKSRSEISEIMNISHYTVDDHKKAIAKKFNLKSVNDLDVLSQTLGFGMV